MAMKVSFMGQVNGSGSWAANAGTDLALFLKVFGHEVLATFETKSTMLGKGMEKTITEGKSSSFPVFGTASSRYHTPGESLLTDQDAASQDYLSTIKNNEKVIVVDDLLTASTFIDNLDEARNHWQARSPYVKELGRALAKSMDRNLIGLATLAARGSATITGGYGGSVLSVAGIVGAANRKTMTAAQAIALLHNAARRLDDKDVPEDGRYCVMEPWLYYTIVNSTDGRVLINTDYSSGGNGSAAKAKIYEVAGIVLLKSNNAAAVFGQNLTSVAGQQNTYTGDFRCTNMIVFHESAIGTVKLLDLALESDYMIERQGHLFVAKYAIGHGILRPESAIAIRVTPTGAEESGASTDTDGSI